MSCYALLPLRGGSKGIPRKNLKLLCHQPLFYWSLKAALESQYFDKIFVSTEDLEIKSEVRRLFEKDVEIHHRSESLAGDTVSSEAVLLDFLTHHSCETLTLIQATSPLTQPMDFQQALLHFKTHNLDSLFSGCQRHSFVWTATDLSPINYDPKYRPRRQDSLPLIIENGAFYIMRSDLLLNEKCRLGGKIGCHLMPDETLFEIDTAEDWALVEALLQKTLTRQK